jgi:hypothetical protein
VDTKFSPSTNPNDLAEHTKQSTKVKKVVFDEGSLDPSHRKKEDSQRNV